MFKSFDEAWLNVYGDHKDKSAIWICLKTFVFLKSFRDQELVGVKILGDDVYLSIPRWLPGVPSTLNWLPGAAIGESHNATAISPFPNWEMQELSNCSAIQNVQSMEIDSQNRMWVLDVGTRNLFLPQPDYSCPPKILLLDLPSGNLLTEPFVFPENISFNSFLNDLVIDMSNPSDPYAYISDAGNGAIVVFQLTSRKAWRFEDAQSMKAEKGDASKVIIGGRLTMLRANVDGIALSPLKDKAHELFFCPLASFNIYSIPTYALRRPQTNVSSLIKNLGKRNSQSDGMMMDNEGNLFWGLLAHDGIAVLSEELRQEGQSVSPETVVTDHKRLQWVDGFGFDNIRKYLWLVSNRLQNLQAGQVNLSETNYRLFRLYTGTKSYMYRK